MKIIHVSTYPPKGEKHSEKSGVASYLMNLLTAMPTNDADEVYVLCDKTSDEREEYVENGITVVRCFDRKVSFEKQLSREVERLQPNIIHVQQELALFGNALTALLLSRFVRRYRKHGLAITLHGVVAPSKISKKFVSENNSKLPVPLVKLAFYVIYKPLTIWAQKVIVHEEHFKTTLVDEYKVKPEKINVIHHGIENLQAQDSTVARTALELPVSQKLVLFMGFATGYKGLDVLIEGFALYAKTSKDVTLVIGAGKHPKLQEDADYMSKYEGWQKKAKELIPAGQYRWIGFIQEKDIGLYYSASDVSVYPYTVAMSSSGPMSIAIGYARPFLASEVFREVLQDDSLLFDGTPQGLAAKLEYFFTNQEGYRGTASQLKRERLWPNVSRTTRALYEEMQ